MPTVGITGGLATGKSLVTARFKAEGAVVFSADEAARATLEPNGPVLRQIGQAFGPGMIRPDGSLDRARLGRRIFADPQARERLNQITHPPILRLLRAQIDGAQTDLPSGTVVAVEVPLLFETRLQDWFDVVVTVVAPEEVQIARLKARDGLGEAEARRRLAAQWPLAEKAARADVVIVNAGTVETVAEAVHALVESLKRAPKGPQTQF